MSEVSRQARILIHQRDSRVGSLSEFTEFQQRFRTQPNQSSKNSVDPEWISAELPRSSYYEDSHKPGNPLTLRTLPLCSLQRLNLEVPLGGGGLNLTFFTLSARGEHHGIYRRSRVVLWLKIGRVRLTYQADRPCNLAGCSSFLLALPLGIGYL
jgi:hypothetical protein